MAQKNGWLANLFKPRGKEKAMMHAASFNGREPHFTPFGNSVLYSNIVLSSVKMKCKFFSKLEPRYIRRVDGSLETITDTSVSRLLRNPNPYQTTSDFLHQAMFIKSIAGTCFIYPDYYISRGGYRFYTNMYILIPSQTPTIYDDNGILKIGFKFNGYSDEVIFDYNEIIVWRDAEDQQYFGGGDYSEEQKRDALNSITAYHQIKESIAEAAKLSCFFDGFIKVNAYAQDEEKVKAIRDKFVEDVRSNKANLPVIDNGADYVSVQRSLKMVDAATLSEIKSNILIFEGVTLEMLQGKFTTAEKEAFYELHIEPAAISLGQAMSKCFFTQWQTSHGDEIILYPNKIQLMATTEIVSVVQSTINAGVFMIDEYREMLGYAPLPNGEGKARPRGFNNLDGTVNTIGEGENDNGKESEGTSIEE